MVCPRCGAGIAPASGRFCPSCRTSIDTAVGMSASATDDGDAPTQPFALPTEAEHTMMPAAAVALPLPPSRSLAAGQAFGSRYHIIRPVGIRGRGAVYQAWDAELGVAVAIKVIRREVMAAPAAAADVERRLQRELRWARQVTHPNVVRIHDLGDIDGMKCITMPYIDGSDMAAVLRREGRQPMARVLRIAGAIVSGLVAAHKA